MGFSDRKGIWYCVALAVIAIVFLHQYVFLPGDQFSGDLVLFYLSHAELLKESITEYGNFLPLWNPYGFSGMPYYGKANALGFNYLLGPLLLILTPLAALKISLIIGLILSGITMFLLANHLIKNKEAACIAAFVYMFNGYILVSVFHWGWVPYAYAYPLLPLVILCVLRALKEDFLVWSIVAGLLMAVQIHAGTGIIFLYTTIAVNLLLFTHLLGKDFKKRLVKVLIVGCVAYLFTFGIAAIKILPVQEESKLSSRQFSYEESSGRSVPLSGIWNAVIESSFQGFGNPQSLNSKIGVVALILLIFAFAYWRNRYVLYLGAVALVALLISMDTFVQYLVWKWYPGWEGMRYANRGLVLFVFSGALLAGYGFVSFSKWIRNKVSIKESKIPWIFAGIFAVLIIDLLVLGVGPTRYDPSGRFAYGNIDEMVRSNQIMNHIASEPGIFRTHVYETHGIDWGTEFYTVPLQIETIYAYESVWNLEYFNEFLAVSWQNPARFWGILNTKYITSTRPLNISGLKLVKEFPKCDVCFPSIPELTKAYGPYLYENTNVMPRAYMIDKSILVIGKDGDISEPGTAKNLMYSLLFIIDPKQAVILLGGEHIGDYTVEELGRYSVIVLGSGALEQSDIPTLQQFKNAGGVLLPDVVAGEQTISDGQLQHLLGVVENATFTPINDYQIHREDFEHQTIELPSSQGKYLVLSETYDLYPGWKAVTDHHEFPIQRAEGVISALYLDQNTSQITFSYEPKSVKIGIWISALTIVLAGAVLIVRRRKYAKKNDN
ncbi:hypothetical protein J4464_01720 [Candidatus Woesearchaeota archaeon]|nr:hypothetical protein [uncultured archaeon]MBS3142083.1 hypothetical protein [Candidatus Woesearchaeota archaeon]